MSNIRIKDSSLKDRMHFLISLYGYERTEDWIDIVNHRSERSMLREWATHKLLYNLHIKEERTKDVDIDYPQSIFYKIGYFIVGEIALMFYR